MLKSKPSNVLDIEITEHGIIINKRTLHIGMNFFEVPAEIQELIDGFKADGISCDLVQSSLCG